jgi:predicted enzyme related to lactoylglutathione lyase
MGQPVVHFEVIGSDPARLRDYYSALFGWEFDTSGSVAPSVSQQGNYGFTDTDAPDTGVAASDAPDGGARIPGGVGGGPGYDSHALFYVGVPDVEAALRQAESLGGTRRMGPEQAPGRDLVVGQFTDPEGNLIGVAGPA